MHACCDMNVYMECHCQVELQYIYWVHVDEMLEFARFLEVMGIDSTSCVNVYKYFLGMLVASNSNRKNICGLRYLLMSEPERAFMLLFISFRLVYGDAARRHRHVQYNMHC